jgi:hypothetical protein
VAAGGTIAGSGKTSDGRPIEKFEVSYDGWPEGALGTMNASGRISSPAQGKVEGKAGQYEIRLPPGQYTTEAMAIVQWHDRPYHFQLETADGSDDKARATLSATTGIKRDYVWKLTGPRRGRDVGYEGSGWERNVHGATIYFYADEVERADRKPVGLPLRESNPDDSIEFTLVPKGKLIDGSEGKTVVEKVEISRAGKYSAGIRGIPTGDYTLSAKLVKKDGSTEPLRVSLTQGKWSKDSMTTYTMPWQPSVDIVFPPAQGVMRYYGTEAVKVYVGR